MDPDEMRDDVAEPIDYERPRVLAVTDIEAKLVPVTG